MFETSHQSLFGSPSDDPFSSKSSGFSLLGPPNSSLMSLSTDDYESSLLFFDDSNSGIDFSRNDSEVPCSSSSRYLPSTFGDVDLFLSSLDCSVGSELDPFAPTTLPAASNTCVPVTKNHSNYDPMMNTVPKASSSMNTLDSLAEEGGGGFWNEDISPSSSTGYLTFSTAINFPSSSADLPVVSTERKKTKHSTYSRSRSGGASKLRRLNSLQGANSKLRKNSAGGYCQESDNRDLYSFDMMSPNFDQPILQPLPVSRINSNGMPLMNPMDNSLMLLPYSYAEYNNSMGYIPECSGRPMNGSYSYPMLNPIPLMPMPFSPPKSTPVGFVRSSPTSDSPTSSFGLPPVNVPSFPANVQAQPQNIFCTDHPGMLVKSPSYSEMPPLDNSSRPIQTSSTSGTILKAPAPIALDSVSSIWAPLSQYPLAAETSASAGSVAPMYSRDHGTTMAGTSPADVPPKSRSHGGEKTSSERKEAKKKKWKKEQKRRNLFKVLSECISNVSSELAADSPARPLLDQMMVLVVDALNDNISKPSEESNDTPVVHTWSVSSNISASSCISERLATLAVFETLASLTERTMAAAPYRPNLQFMAGIIDSVIKNLSVKKEAASDGDSVTGA